MFSSNGKFERRFGRVMAVTLVLLSCLAVHTWATRTSELNLNVTGETVWDDEVTVIRDGTGNMVFKDLFTTVILSALEVIGSGDGVHSHSFLDASDGLPTATLSLDAVGAVTIVTNLDISPPGAAAGELTVGNNDAANDTITLGGGVMQWTESLARFAFSNPINVSGNGSFAGDVEVGGNDIFFQAGTESFSWNNGAGQFELTDGLVLSGPTDELVTNGSFTGDSDWTKGSLWTLPGTVATCSNASTGGNLTQTIGGVSVGEKYRVTFDVTAGAGNAIIMSIGGEAGASVNTVDTFVQNITASGTGDLTFDPTGAPTSISIDNVSVVEITAKVLQVDNGDLDVDGDITADSYTDHTPGWAGSSEDALTTLAAVRSVDGRLDHRSLPKMARRRIMIFDEDDNITTETIGRDLGAMITIQTESIKALRTRNMQLKNRVDNQKARLEVLETQVQELIDGRP